MNRDERIAELLKPHIEGESYWTDADIKVIRCLMEDAWGYGHTAGAIWASKVASQAIERKVAGDA